MCAGVKLWVDSCDGFRRVEFNETARIEAGHGSHPRASATTSLSALPGGCSPQMALARARKSGCSAGLAGTTLATTLSCCVTCTLLPRQPNARFRATAAATAERWRSSCSKDAAQFNPTQGDTSRGPKAKQLSLRLKLCCRFMPKLKGNRLGIAVDVDRACTMARKITGKSKLQAAGVPWSKTILIPTRPFARSGARQAALGVFQHGLGLLAGAS